MQQKQTNKNNVKYSKKDNFLPPSLPCTPFGTQPMFSLFGCCVADRSTPKGPAR